MGDEGFVALQFVSRHTTSAPLLSETRPPSASTWCSKNVVFSAEDVYELVNMLDGSGGAGKHGAELPLARTLGPGSQLRGPILRPSRLRAVLASRACRSSIMIGSALSMPTMRRILARLAGLQSPWNCPHGRPTMRHLCTLPELRG